MFAIVSIIVLLVFIPFSLETEKLYEIYKYKAPVNYDWPGVTDLSFSGVTAVSFLIIERIIEELFLPCYYKICKEKEDEEIRERRSRKAVKNIFKFFYYLGATFCGWYVLKDTAVLPPSLLGKGDIYNTFKDYPYVEVPRFYHLYFTGSMGYHIGQTVSHFFAKDKANDYLEMMFIHIVTSYLFAFSYLTNTLIGGVIAFLHDIADILICFTRIFAETDY